jgi:hypothetical protein
MGEAGNIHPFRRVRRLLRRIKNPRLRYAVLFFAMFALQLAAGKAVETVLSPGSLHGAKAAQAVWLAKLKEFTPLELGRGYMADFGPAMRGDILYRAAAPAATGPFPEEVTAALQADAERRARCVAAREAATEHAPCALMVPAGLSSSQCMVESDRPACAEYLQCLEEAGPVMSAKPLECAGLGASPFGGVLLGAGLGDATPLSSPDLLPENPRNVIPGILAPLAALARTVTRVFSGGFAAIVPIMQLGLGFLGATLFLKNRSRAGVDSDDFFALVIMGPILVIAIGSLAALALQWVMIGGLEFFGWVTGLAGMAAAATGFAGACWYCFTKLAEKGVEGALTGKLL